MLCFNNDAKSLALTACCPRHRNSSPNGSSSASVEPLGSHELAHRANDIVRRQRPSDLLKLELADWLDGHGVLRQPLLEANLLLVFTDLHKDRDSGRDDLGSKRSV
jgi:hypothetical protein